MLWKLHTGPTANNAFFKKKNTSFVCVWNYFFLHSHTICNVPIWGGGKVVASWIQFKAMFLKLGEFMSHRLQLPEFPARMMSRGFWELKSMCHKVAKFEKHQIKGNNLGQLFECLANYFPFKKNQCCFTNFPVKWGRKIIWLFLGSWGQKPKVTRRMRTYWNCTYWGWQKAKDERKKRKLRNKDNNYIKMILLILSQQSLDYQTRGLLIFLF